MARKYNTKTADNVRAQIQGTVLVKRLQDHHLGKLELTDSQIETGKFLLSYALPKPAQQVEQTGQITIAWQK